MDLYKEIKICRVCKNNLETIKTFEKPFSSDVAQLKRFSIPLIRRIYPSLIGNSIVTTQPLLGANYGWKPLSESDIKNICERYNLCDKCLYNIPNGWLNKMLKTEPEKWNKRFEWYSNCNNISQIMISILFDFYPYDLFDEKLMIMIDEEKEIFKANMFSYEGENTLYILKLKKELLEEFQKEGIIESIFVD